MVSHEDVMELKKVFDDRYVMQDTCNERQESINKKLANDDKRIDILIRQQELNNKQQKLNNWLTSAIAAGIITLVIKVFLGG